MGRYYDEDERTASDAAADRTVPETVETAGAKKDLHDDGAYPAEDPDYEQDMDSGENSEEADDDSYLDDEYDEDDPDSDIPASRHQGGVHRPGERGGRHKSRRRNHGRRLKWLIPVLIVLAVLAFFYFRKRSSVQAVEYREDTAARRDITTSDSYTGTVEAKDSQSVMSAVTGAKVSEVLVEEGDSVRKGDPIVKLDTEDVEKQIEEKQASLSAQQKQSSLSIQSAQKSYSDLSSNIAEGLDSTTQQALSGIDQAMSALVSAQDAYNNEVTLNNDQLSATILQAIQQVENAYNSVQTAALSTQQAIDSKNATEEDASDSGRELSDSETTQLQASIDSAQLREDQAWDSYEQAQTDYRAATMNEENNLTKLYDALIQAENSYLTAIDSYNAAVRSNEQRLQDYALQIQQAQANADTTVSELQIQDLQDSLEDYVITAPISGRVTQLNVSEGDITAVSATTSLATITNYDTMKVTISVSEYDIAALNKGDHVTVTVDALDRDYDGVVTSIDAEGTASNGITYFDTEVEFTPDDKVMIGMTAEITITVTEAEDAVTLTNDAVMTDTDGSSYVYKKEDSADKASGGKDPAVNADGYRKVKIETGSTDGTYTEITGGLSEGDTIYYTITTAESSTNASGMFGNMMGNSGGGPGQGGQGGPGGGPGGGGQPAGNSSNPPQ